MGLALVSEDTGDHGGAMLGDRAYRPDPPPQHLHGQAGHFQNQAYAPRAAAAPSFPTAEVIAVLTAIAAILGARLSLLLSGAGAWLLAYQATSSESSVWPVVIFCLGVVLPVVTLSWKRAL